MRLFMSKCVCLKLFLSRWVSEKWKHDNYKLPRYAYHQKSIRPQEYIILICVCFCFVSSRIVAQSIIREQQVIQINTTCYDEMESKSNDCISSDQSFHFIKQYNQNKTTFKGNQNGQLENYLHSHIFHELQIKDCPNRQSVKL